MFQGEAWKAVKSLMDSRRSDALEALQTTNPLKDPSVILGAQQTIAEMEWLMDEEGLFAELTGKETT